MYFAKSTNGFYTEDIHGDQIPPDAYEITIEEHAALLAGQSAGKIITGDSDGRPFLSNPPALTPEPLPTANELIIRQITGLEATVTPRRIREAVLGIDNGWLAALNTQVAALRDGLS